MENVIYRIELNSDAQLEFYVCDTNELNPVRDIKEIGIVLLEGNNQLDGQLNENELDSLIDYLNDCKHYIAKFNEKSNPNK